MNDKELREGIENATLGSHLFNHKEHLQLAWIYLNEFDFETAVDKMSYAINHYVTTLGFPEKFHQTVTYVAMHLMQYYKQKDNIQSLDELIEAYPFLMDRMEKTMFKYYSPGLLFLKKSQQTIVPPDNHDLPKLKT